MFGLIPDMVAMPVFDDAIREWLWVVVFEAISEWLLPVIVELLVDSDAKLVCWLGFCPNSPSNLSFCKI
jgi:hypothetical protein